MNKCRSCGKFNLSLILDLNNHPWCNNFITQEQIGQEKTYPLQLLYCEDCELVQIGYTVAKETMFQNHTYVSGTTDTVRQYFYEIAKENVKQFQLNKNDVILDIGGNDGTLLQQYKALGITKCINVESATKIAKMSQDNGIDTLNTFFNKDIISQVPKIKLINAANVFYHVEELHSILYAIKNILQKDGIFIIQCTYLANILQLVEFDIIYHEHLCYYSLQSLQNLLSLYDLNIFDSYKIDIHGGSLVVKVCHNHQYQKTDRLLQLQKLDKFLVNKEKILKFAQAVPIVKNKLITLLKSLKQQGKTIYGLGSPAKGTTMLIYCGIDHTILDGLLEKNPLKYGLYSPMTHIPIIPEDFNNIPNNSYLLVLSWNFFKEIYNHISHITKKKNIKFILPLTSEIIF